MMFALTTRRIDPAALLAEVSDARAGAVVVFVGTTRRENAGRQVHRLEYEAFERMAIREMRQLGAEARRRWPLKKVAMVHRTGIVPVREASVAIAVSAAHRTEAFEACRWLIDRLKEIVPIWKKEHFRGGEVWIGLSRSAPPTRRASQRRRAR